MIELVFVDTNVLIYAVDKANPTKQKAAKLWRDELWKSRLGRISFQVLQEFYANVSRRWPAARKQTVAEIRNLLSWRPVSIDALVLETAWRIEERYLLSFWDSLIVSTAKAASCRYLLTEDLQAGQDLDGVVVVNPFRTDPGKLSSA